MLRWLFRQLARALMAPRFRYSIPAYALRALFQPQHGEEVLDRAVLLLAVQGVQGDWLEFGVFEGRSLLHAWHAHRWVEHLARSGGAPILADLPVEPFTTRRFVGFDSFQGLPAPQEPELGWMRAGAFAAPLDAVRRRLRHIPPDRLHLVPGWFDDTLTAATRDRLGLRRVAAVHIDCDLRSSTAQALAFVEPVLADGALILFDDWWLYGGRADRGEPAAFADFLAAHPHWRAVEVLRGTTLAFALHRVAEVAQ